jgi:hypothetical protein
MVEVMLLIDADQSCIVCTRCAPCTLYYAGRLWRSTCGTSGVWRQKANCDTNVNSQILIPMLNFDT